MHSGSLSNCLVEGESSIRKGAPALIKQRAVAISIVLQSLALIALVLFSTSQQRRAHLSLKKTRHRFPPYAPIGNHHHRPVRSRPAHFCAMPILFRCRVCQHPFPRAIQLQNPTGPDGVLNPSARHQVPARLAAAIRMEPSIQCFLLQTISYLQWSVI